MVRLSYCFSPFIFFLLFVCVSSLSLPLYCFYFFDVIACFNYVFILECLARSLWIFLYACTYSLKSHAYKFLVLWKNLGKLHNLARALADEETEREQVKEDGSRSDRKGLLLYSRNGVIGLGLKILKQLLITSAAGDNNIPSGGYDVKETGKRLFGTFSSRMTTFLSQFVLYLAAIGDIVDGTDTTHDFNYFSLVYEWPKDVSFLFPSFITIAGNCVNWQK